MRIATTGLVVHRKAVGDKTLFSVAFSQPLPMIVLGGEQMRLFHSTNEAAALSAQKTGLGLTLDDYRDMLSRIANKHSIPLSVVDYVINKWTAGEDLNRCEFTGGVCCFPTLADCLRLTAHYGSFGGEFKGSLLKRFRNTIARKHFRLPITHLVMQPIIADIEVAKGGVTPPVVIEIEVPVSDIANWESDGDSGSELYTNSKVPSSNIVAVHKIGRV